MRLFRATIAVALLFCSGAAQAADGVSVDRISFAKDADDGDVVIRFHVADPILAYGEPVPTADDAIELVIFNAELGHAYAVEAPLAPVRGIRLTPVKSHLRVVISLDPAVRVRARATRDRATSDLLVRLTPSDAARPLPVAALPEPTVRYPGASEAVVQLPSEPAARSAAQRWRLDAIVVDAGHGGEDEGAVANGVREKDICLAVAHKLGRRIEEELGIRVVYTRRSDRFVELKERGRIANEAGGKLFISLHANAAKSRMASGTETYFLGTHKGDAARAVMERENSVVQLESDPSHYMDMTDEKLILQTLAQSAYMRKSEELASLVEDRLELVSGRSRGVKQAGFYVLWSASMPAILVEMGFLTNPRDAAFLSGEYGQDYVVDAILRAVETYKRRYERELQLVSP